MTRMNLSDAMLLEASGELAPSTRAKLLAYLEKHPEAARHFEQVKGQFETLQSMPRMEMSEELRRKIAGHIKAGIQKKLWQRAAEERSRRRWRIIYRSLAGISAAAAVLVVVAGIWVIENSIAEKKEDQRVAEIESFIRRMDATANRRTDFDDQVNFVEGVINEYQDQRVDQDSEMHNAVSTLATVASDEYEIMPPPEPGSLSSLKMGS